MDTSCFYFDNPGPSNYPQYYQHYETSSAFYEQSWSSSSSGHSLENQHEYSAAYEPQFHPDPLRAECRGSRESFSSASPPLTAGRKPTKKQREQEMEFEEKCLEAEIKELRRQQARYEQYLKCVEARVNDLLCAQKL